MNFLKVVGVVRKVLGKLTDILIAGRNQGLWTEKNSIPGANNPNTTKFDLKEDK